MASIVGGAQGTVKAWIEARGMGFIAPADGSADVFVHRSALVDGNALVVGSSVIFEAGWDDAKGKPIATKCGGAVGATNGSVPGSPTPLPNGQPGTVKAWIENRGMGFITPADGSQDVFVHRSNLVDGNSLVTGSQVIFESGWDEQKDKPIAKAVTGASTNLGGPGHPMVPNGQPGTVKAWIETRGMGFITPANGKDDVFVHRSNLVDGDSLVVGAQVIFELGFDAQKGKPIAKACAGAVPGQGGPPPGHMGFGGGIQTCGGTIKVWFADKGYGFITLDNGMGDAFAGSGAMPPGMIPTDGLRITCSVQWNNEKQKYTAVEIFDASKGKGKGAPGDASDNCFVSGLPLDINETKLQEIFGAYGTVVSCKVLPGEGRPDRAALVRFGSADEAKWIVERVSGETLGLPGPISVKFATSKMAPGQAGPGGKGYGGKGYDGKGFDGKGFGGKGFDGKGYGGKGGGCGPGYGCAGNQFSLPPGRGVQAARLGTVRAVLGNSLLVSPSEGGLDVSVPRELLLDGDPQIGGLVSFSASTGADYGRAPQGGMNNRFSPYGTGGGNFNPQRGGQQSGVVKAWMENRGMGFIAPSDGSADLFVHRSYLQDGGSLALGSQVTFTAEFDPQKGKPIAKNVMGAIPQPPQ